MGGGVSVDTTLQVNDGYDRIYAHIKNIKGINILYTNKEQRIIRIRCRTGYLNRVLKLPEVTVNTTYGMFRAHH